MRRVQLYHTYSPKLTQSVGMYTQYLRCRVCSQKIVPCIDFGNVPLAGGFFPRTTLPNEFTKAFVYPLRICICTHCHLVQCDTSVDSDLLFKKYFYASSAIHTLVNHFTTLAHDLLSKTAHPQSTYIVEIGCNDGVLLRPLQNEGYRVIGVDPATNIIQTQIHKGLPIINAYFTPQVAHSIISSNGHADVIICSHSFAHIPDIHEVMRGIRILLKKNGMFIIETHYLDDLIHGMQYDMMYHEHQFYYSLLSLIHLFAIYSMEIFDVQRLPLRGGTIRVYVQFKKTGTRTILPSVKKLERYERKKGYATLRPYKQFSNQISIHKKHLVNTIHTLVSKKHTIAGYGASGRATAIMSYCGFTHEELKYIIDDAPKKIGAYTPGNYLSIVSSKLLYGTHPPDYVLLFAWPFAKEVLWRHKNYIQHGGKFIVPLPHLSIIDAQTPLP